MAAQVTYTDHYGFIRTTSALVIRVANAAIMAHEGQTVSLDEFGATLEAEYKAQSGKSMPFQSYFHAREYVAGEIALDSTDDTITIPSIMDALVTS